MKDFDFVLTMPTEAELRASSARWYARSGGTFLDNYPDDLKALGPKTTLIEFPKHLGDTFYDEKARDFPPVFQTLSDQIDNACKWDNLFVRLNSRSPKDASYPDPPFACCGRQALYLIRCSERCLDDLCYFSHSEHPAYVALRERIHIRHHHEFRAFVRDGKLACVAQYHKELSGFLTDQRRADLDRECRGFLTETVIPRLHLPDVVVDVCWDHSGPRFLEINPYGLSDPVAARSYDRIEQANGEFFWYEPDA